MRRRDFMAVLGALVPGVLPRAGLAQAPGRAETLRLLSAALPNSFDPIGPGVNRYAIGLHWNAYDRLLRFPLRPQPDGTLRALQVTIFPPAARGTAEGHFPWDLTPSSTMTNGTVGNITSANGRVLTVKYGNAEKQILVPEDVPVVSFEPGTRELLVPGAQIILNGTRAADGTVTAGSISVGKDGLIPPN